MISIVSFVLVAFIVIIVFSVALFYENYSNTNAKASKVELV
jgi:hypothetical protein